MDRTRTNLEEVTAFLKAETTLALATTSREGVPCVAPLFYLLQDGPRLYWFSSASSEHSINLACTPSVAVSIYRQTEEWQQIRGVQMRGTVSLVSDPVLRTAVEVAYTGRFHLDERFAPAISASALYCFHPQWIRFIDNSTRFAGGFELSLPLEAPSPREP